MAIVRGDNNAAPTVLRFTVVCSHRWSGLSRVRVRNGARARGGQCRCK